MAPRSSTSNRSKNQGHDDSTRASFERMQWHPGRDGGQDRRRTNDPDKGGNVITQGIGLLYLETHNWEQSAQFWQDLGFKLKFETDHRSGVLVAEKECSTDFPRPTEP